MSESGPLASMLYDMPLHYLAQVHADILIRQRDSDTHDPGCATVVSNHQNRWRNSAVACDCWLSTCPVEGDKVYYDTNSNRWDKVYRTCPSCKADQPICTESHCMVCGSDCKP